MVQHMHLLPRISKWVAELQEFEYSFIVEETTRAILADVLIYRHRGRKIVIRDIREENGRMFAFVKCFHFLF